MLEKTPSVGCVKQLISTGGYSGFLSDGDDRMGVKIKGQPKYLGFPTKPKKSLD